MPVIWKRIRGHVPVPSLSTTTTTTEEGVSLSTLVAVEETPTNSCKGKGYVCDKIDHNSD